MTIRRQLAFGAAVVVAYFVAATFGFRVAFVAEQVTTVWAPTGIAVAGLLLWGRSLWPAVWLGAFAANAGTQAPLWTAVFVATGNTLEAVAAAWLLTRFAGFDPAFRRTRDGLAFIIIAAGLSTTISATIGVSTLCAAHVQPWTRFSELWSTWWLGDALGALVIAPVLLTFARSATAAGRRVWPETVALLLGTVAATQIVFGQLPLRLSAHPLEYVIFPLVIAAAVRQRQPATALVVLAASAVTIWNTVRGSGPFAGPDIHQSLVLLQVFLAVVAGTGLLLASAIAERETGERRRAAARAVGEVLAQATTLSNAAPALLRVICEKLDWATSALWVVDRNTRRLRCLSVHARLIPSTAPFVMVTREMLFAPGVGLPGRVWATGKALWVENVVRDRNFPRATVASAAGLHGAFAFPIFVGQEVHAVVEFFNRSVLSPDADLLETMSSVGNQIGQFVVRKQVETAAAEGQRRTSAIVETALDAIIGMDHEGIITEFNPAAERTFGYTRAEALGRELADLLIPPQMREQHRHGLARYLSTGQAPFMDRRIETSAVHADGHEFPVEVAITRVRDETPPRFTGFVRDLTARAQAERDREQLLQRELAARREAETANRAKDEFLATLSHELRTPLNAIIGWTRMLLDGTLDERSRVRALEVIDRNSRLLAKLVADILDVSRIITGGLKLDVRPVDLAAVIGSALDVVGPAAAAKKIRLSSRLAATGRLTEGDPHRLQQIVWNLVANAVKFTPEGGLVEVELLDAGDEGLRIRVHDDGQGIAPDFLPHVFDRFSQADGSVSRQHGGLGLGLAIVRHLVELHGGRVSAESPGPGKGATFVVDLPRVEPASPPGSFGESRLAPQAQRNAPLPLAGRKALVVDDEADARDLLAAVLTAAGAEVRTASSVREALLRLHEVRPDVLLADIGMPGEDGYALIREVRAAELGSGERMTAVAVTAYAGHHDRERALLEGFDRHLAKPIDPAEIVEAVRSLSSGAGSL